MNKTSLESSIWKLDVKLYKTGTIYLTLTNRLTNQSIIKVIRKGKVIKQVSTYVV